ncbi:hypothetical protein WN51_14582 [Melipona quadrifasciata]|uniref:Uncharacterized protein n=1 Tax=Melipona quadrifasciata TaxID=166423 RepID=A0A0M8ZXG2_9HYME|nr:hypothetical protein WN51_14582 [Melipona quadrifasciata]
MENSERRILSDEEANKMLNEIFEEDKKENLNSDNNDSNEDDESECTQSTCVKENPATKKKICECMHFAENSSRFSLRVMEAMRLLQLKENRLLPTSTVENIVDYIQTNYRDDGDLYAQVRTALKQVCSQGFVMKLLEHEYHLIGPNAISMNQTTCARSRRDCTMSSPVKTPKRRRKRIDKDDYCEYETTTDEEPEPTIKSRKVSTNERKRSSQRQHEEHEEMPECSCNVEKQTRITQDSLVESSRREGIDQRRRRTVETDDRVTIENDRLNVDNIYNELRDRISPSEAKKREKELKEWLKHCQEECKRQEKRRGKLNN